mmetsp:Transcript_36960/g.105838  ORF Transcript_36960/g.105838 Transcript_36960/m.105838 type:complete len:208 (+) Transcript_36960:517-1140(+)
MCYVLSVSVSVCVQTSRPCVRARTLHLWGRLGLWVCRSVCVVAKETFHRTDERFSSQQEEKHTSPEIAHTPHASSHFGGDASLDNTGWLGNSCCCYCRALISSRLSGRRRCPLLVLSRFVEARCDLLERLAGCLGHTDDGEEQHQEGETTEQQERACDGEGVEQCLECRPCAECQSPEGNHHDAHPKPPQVGWQHLRRHDVHQTRPA